MIVTVAQVKGGVGKSMIAVNLAAGMKRGTVAMLDTDVLRASYVWAETRKRINDKHFKDRSLAEVPCYTAESVAEFKELILKLDEQYQHVVIDSGGFDSDLGRLATLAADVEVIPTSPDYADLRGVRYTLDMISKVRKDDELVKVVIGNRFDRPIDVKRFYEREAVTLNAHVAETYLRSLKEYPRAFNYGLAAVEYERHSTAALRFASLYRELNNFTRKESAHVA